ncbi:hypothetical protein HWV62_43652 [Athelia sp. TMB]|nr:hypothetical protein HWV62_43652 [Athelia sp. TMB]
MDSTRVPVELWEEILSYTCVDGGRTSCSLSLVSRTFHAASQRSRYYSVALWGLPAVLRFAEVIEKRQDKDIRLYHLYATDQYPYTYSKPLLPIKEPHAISALIKKITKGGDAIQAAAHKDPVLTALEHDPSLSVEELMHIALLTILRAVAHTLRTLSIAVDYRDSCPEIPALPSLTELTLNYSSGEQPRLISEVLATLGPLPALQRLDLLKLRCEDSPDEIMKQVKMMAPKLTHICLPIIRGANLRNMMGQNDAAFWVRVDGGELKVYIHLNPWREGAEASATRRVESKLTGEAKRRGEEKFIFYARKKPIEECHEEQEQNWLARVVEGRGRWRHPKKTKSSNVEEKTPEVPTDIFSQLMLGHTASLGVPSSSRNNRSTGKRADKRSISSSVMVGPHEWPERSPYWIFETVMRALPNNDFEGDVVSCLAEGIYVRVNFHDSQTASRVVNAWLDANPVGGTGKLLTIRRCDERDDALSEVWRRNNVREGKRRQV